MGRRLEIGGVSKARKATLVKSLEQILFPGSHASASPTRLSSPGTSLPSWLRAEWSGSFAAPGPAIVEGTAPVGFGDLNAGQVNVSRTKFAPAVHQHLLLEPGARLPDRYGQNRIQLMVRDPHSLFVYWEVTPERPAEAFARGFRNAVLRVYLADDGEGWDDATVFDLQRGDAPRSWHIQVPCDDCDYRVSVGYVNDRGDFLSLLESNTVRTPRAGESPVIDDRFARLPFEAPLRGKAGGAKWLPGFGYAEDSPATGGIHRAMARLSLRRKSRGRVPGGEQIENEAAFAPPGSQDVGSWNELRREREGMRLQWSSSERSFAIRGRAPSGMRVRINGVAVASDATEDFHFSVPLQGGEDQVVIAHSLDKDGTWEIAVQAQSAAGVSS